MDSNLKIHILMYKNGLISRGMIANVDKQYEKDNQRGKDKQYKIN